MVPMAGLEPAPCCQEWILSPSRLPIPSHRLTNLLYHRLCILSSTFYGKSGYLWYKMAQPLKNSVGEALVESKMPELFLIRR